MEAVSNCQRMASRLESTFAVAMLDLDNFKHVNDTYGHSIGDNVLVGLSQLMKRRIRQSDIAGRYGGEEFIVVFSGVNQQDVVPLIGRIFQSVREEQFECDGQLLRITVSAGAVCVSELTAQPATPEALIAIADHRLYEAKAGGRNCLFDGFGLSHI